MKCNLSFQLIKLLKNKIKSFNVSYKLFNKKFIFGNNELKGFLKVSNNKIVAIKDYQAFFIKQLGNLKKKQLEYE